MAIKSFGFASAGGGAGTDNLDDVTSRGATTTNAITVGGVTVGTEYSLPTLDGSANQVLQTNGTGTVSFATLDFTGGLEYKGAFNATAGTPSLLNAEKGDFYIIDTAGTIYGQTWAVGDHLLINEDMGGTITNSKIDKIDNTQAVTSVNTQTGAVVLSGNDLLADHTAVNYTAANNNIDGHLSGIDSALGAVASPTLDDVTTNGDTTTNAINVGTITTSGNVLADSADSRTIGAEGTRFITYYGDMNGAIRFKAKNDEGVQITKGQAVYIKGLAGDGTTPTVGLADADNPAKMPAFGLAFNTANNSAEIQIVQVGNLGGLDTSGFSVGDTLYIDTTAGAVTKTKPTGESSQLQNIGRVIRSDNGDGVIMVGGAGRSAATPNLDQDKIFLGNASNQSVSTALNTIGLSKFNNDSGFLTDITSESLNDLSDVSFTAGAGIDNYVLTYDNTTSSWGAEVVPSAPVTSVNTQTGAVVVSGNDILADHTAVNYTASNNNVDGHFSGVDSKLGTLLADITGESLNDLSDVSFTAGAGIDNYVLTYDNGTSTWGAEVVPSAPVTSVNTQTGAVVVSGNDILADHTAVNYTASNNNVDGHFSGVDTKLGTLLADITSESLNDLSDVSFTAGAGIDNYVLTYDNSTTSWGAEAAPTASAASETVAGVIEIATNAEATAGTATDKALVPSNISSLDLSAMDNTTSAFISDITSESLNDLSDVSFTAGAGIDNYVLTYDNTTSSWGAEAAPTASAASETTAGVIEIATNAEATAGTATDKALVPSNLSSVDLSVLDNTTSAFITSGDIPTASETTAGVIEIATNAEATAGTATDKALVPSNLSSVDLSVLDNTTSAFISDITSESLNDLSDVSFTAGAGIDNYVLTYDNGTSSWGAELVPSAPVTSVNTLTGAVVVSGDDIAADHTATNYTASNANVDGHLSGIDTKLGTLLSDITGESLNDLSDVSFTAGAGIDNYVLKYDNGTNSWGAEAESTAAAASETVAGVIEIATNAEATASTATDKALVPSNISSLDLSAMDNTTSAFISGITSESLNDLSDVSFTAGAGIDNYVLTYDNTTSSWGAEAAPTASAASETTAGVIEIATNAEATAGTATDKALVPSNLSSVDLSVLDNTTSAFISDITSESLNDLSDVSFTAGAGIDNYV